MASSAPPPVRFENRLAANAFIQQRYQESGLTPTQLAQQLGLRNAGSVSQLLRGRQLISKSKHFDQFCTLLNITVEERDGIWWAEQGQREARRG